MKIEKTCITCGDKFFVWPNREKTAKTCSQPCRGAQIAKAYAEKRTVVVCGICGTEIKNLPPSHAKKTKFCSRKCANESFERRKVPVGKDHFNWRGGNVSHRDGYRYLNAPNHPAAAHGNYVLEHRIVMEEWMREVSPAHPFLEDVGGAKYLKRDIQVHHINEVRRDNRRANLLACTTAAHADIHRGVAPMQGEVWPEIEGLRPLTPRWVSCSCYTCGKQFERRATEVKRSAGILYCCRACYLARPARPNRTLRITHK